VGGPDPRDAAPSWAPDPQNNQCPKLTVSTGRFPNSGEVPALQMETRPLSSPPRHRGGTLLPPCSLPVPDPWPEQPG
jgi:hypothetical protein